jgi:hypothetical protein
MTAASNAEARRRAAWSALILTAVLGLAACGSDEKGSARSKQPAATISEEKAYSSPKSVTCTDIQTQSQAAGKATRAAATALARTVQLRDASQYETAQRLVFAMNDLCERADDASYRPAADALRAVKSGRYRLSG